MNAQEYHESFVQLVGDVASITRSEITFREIDENECYLKAILTFATQHTLHIAEYVTINDDVIVRLKYRYQLLDPYQKHLRRWDNAPHHNALENFPNHYHDELQNVHPSRVFAPLDAILLAMELIESENAAE